MITLLHQLPKKIGKLCDDRTWTPISGFGGSMAARNLLRNIRIGCRDINPMGLGVSVISCWEVAKLVENGRLKLQCPVEEWIEQALAYPGVQLLQLTPGIAVESTQFPGSFHRDPADQIIVATARKLDVLS